MGTYYGVTAVEKLGKPYQKPSGSNPTSALGADEILVAILYNGLWRIAADVSDPKEFDRFDQSYGNGHWLRMDLVTILKSQANDCPDEGRVKGPPFSSKSVTVMPPQKEAGR